jgi:hypothetical protein
MKELMPDPIHPESDATPDVAAVGNRDRWHVRGRR